MVKKAQGTTKSLPKKPAGKVTAAPPVVTLKHIATQIAEAVKGLGIEIHAGLHTGEVELRGDDVGGVAVHIAARINALAAPGEVLVSRTVKDLVTGSGIRFAERGSAELKGIPGQWRLYAVEAA